MKGIFELLIVFSIMTGLLLSSRILFVHYVSDDWFGSLGIITGISISVIVLAKKRKLGWFGPMLERQIYKFQRGKRGLVIFTESALLVVVLGVMIFTIEQGNSVYFDLKTEFMEDNLSIKSPKQILESAGEMTIYDWFAGVLMIPVVFGTEFPQFSAFIASIDQRLDGWIMHFYTVGFVENLEVLGILIFYRVGFKKRVILKIKRMLGYNNTIKT